MSLTVEDDGFTRTEIRKARLADRKKQRARDPLTKRTYCRTCGVYAPRHWPGCPKGKK